MIRKLARFSIAACMAAVVLQFQTAHSANLTWDSSGANPIAPTDGSGSWNSTTAANWSNAATDAVWDNISTAVFGNNNGAAGTVTINDLSGTVTAAGLTFNKPGSGSYTVAASGANTLTLSGTNPNLFIAPTVSATVSAPIVGSFTGGTSATGAGLFINGGGALTLNGNFSGYSGNTTVAYNTADHATATNVTLASGGSLGNASGDVYVGFITFTTGGSTDTSALTMAAGGTGTLTANNLFIDYLWGQQTASTTTGSQLLVNGNDTINANNIIITAGRSNGNTKGGFGQLRLGAGATLTLNGAAGVGTNVTKMDIANYVFESGGSTGTGTNGIADFSPGTVNGTIGEIDIATGKGGGSGSTGISTGEVDFSNGALNATVIKLARTGRQPANGTLKLVAGGAGTLTAGGITFGETGNAGASTATGTIQIDGATLAMTGDINNNPSSTTNTTTGTINLNGGTLDMAGHAIGSAGKPVTLTATAGTLKDLASINSATTGPTGVTMSGTGAQVLTLIGTNSYTGNTTITGGTLIANGAASMGTGGALAVNGGTLDLHGFGQSVSSLSGTGATAVITNNGVSSPATLTVTAGTGSYAGVIQNGASGVGLALSGGTLNLTSLSSPQTYTGNTTVASGATLTIANINSSTAVTANGNFIAGGTVGSILVDSAGSLTPGPAIASNSTGALNASSLTIGNGTGSLNFLLSSASAFDQLMLSGAANLNGGLTVNATLNGALTSGNYVLVNAPGGLHLNGNTVTPNIVVGGGGQTRVSGLLSETATQIVLQVNGNPASLTWTGTADHTSWDIVNHANWTSAAPSDPTHFYNADSVTFPTVAPANQTVVVASGVAPGATLFTNNGTSPYTIQGSGIGGAGGLTVNGGGSVTLQNANTYAGNTTVTGNSTLVIDSTGAIAGSTLQVNSGATATVNSGGQITTTTLNVSGNLNNSGTIGGTTLTLSSPAVATIAAGGALNTPTVAINGGTLTIQSGGTIASTTVAVATGASLTVQASGAVTGIPALTNDGTVTFSSDQTIGSLNNTAASAVINQTGTLTVNNGGTYSGAIKDGGPGGLTVSGGTLTLTGANNYTGPTTVNAGATLQLDSGSNTGSLSSTTGIATNGTGTFIYARTDSPSFANALSGNGRFRQIGGGTMTLTADNSSFSGALQAYNGTLVQGSANPNTLGTGAALVLGTPGIAATTTPVGNITLSAAIPATTVSTISATNSSTTANPIADVLTIPAGVTLTATGTTTVGPNLGGLFTTLNITGGGAFSGAAVNIANGNGTATLDLSGLNSATINGNVNVGADTGIATLNLANTTVAGNAPTSSITAGTINVSNTSSGSNSQGLSAINLGAGTNTLTATTLNLGTGRGNGAIQFAAGAPATASVTIAGAAGGTTAINIATANGNGPVGNGTSGLFLAGYTANIQATSLNIATSSSNQGNTLVAGAVTFDTGTFMVGGGSGTVTVGAITGGGSTTTAGVNGSITIGGPSPNNTATGVFSSGGITLGNFTNAVAAVDAAAVATATFTVNGGTASISGNISNTSTQGTTVSTVNLLGGTLNMNGNSIGGAGGVNSGAGPIAVNFPAAGQSATLANLGGAGINGAGLTMNTAGRLILTGNNTYSGDTLVTQGTLWANGNHTGGGNFNVGSGGTLGGNGTIAAPSIVTVQAGGSLAPGASTGTLTVGGTVNLSGGSVLNTALQGNLSGVLDTTAGTLNIDSGVSANFTLLGNLTKTSFVFGKYTGAIGGTSGQFTGAPTFTVPAGVPTPTGAQISYANSQLTLTVSPQSLRGNFNLDDKVDVTDISAMLSALTDLNKYATSHNLSPSDLLALGDFDNSGSVTNRDIQPFLNYLAGIGGGSIAAVPEPGSLALLASGLLGLGMMRRRRNSRFR